MKKNIKREYGRNRYQNMSEENKQRLKEYQKSYRKKKNQHKKLLSIFLYIEKKWNKKL